jgi:galactose mutarotase-like enzyme
MNPPAVLVVADEPPLAAAVAAPPGTCSRTVASQGGFEVIELRSQAGLEARFAPGVGMACCSLRMDGTELLGERFGLEAYALRGASMGLSLLHPWADRLSRWHYTASGTTVRLPLSPLLHTDRWGLPVNGVQSAGHVWHVDDSRADGRSAWLEATLPFEDDRRLALFPFPHRVHLRAEVAGRSLYVFTEVMATRDVPVPVCFGYRVYLRHDAGCATATTLSLPERRGVVTDARLIPSGRIEQRRHRTLHLGADDVDEVFALGKEHALSVVSGARRITLESLAGYPLAAVRTLPGEPHVQLEALTAGPDALSRDAFPVAAPGRPFRTALRLGVQEARS